MSNAAIIDTLFVEGVKHFNYPQPLCRCSYDEVKRFESWFERALMDEGFDYKHSYRCTTPKGVYLSGNVGSLVNGYIRYNFKEGWSKVENPDIDRLISNAPNIYKSRFDVAVEPLSADKAVALVKEGHNFRNRGIGSCASVAESGADVYIDTDGNILVSPFVFVWD